MRNLLLGLYQYLAPRDVIGIFYHSVSDQYLPHIQHLYIPEPVQGFEAALRYITRHASPVRYEQLESWRLHGNRLPRKALHLSFDGGYAECFTAARPLLLKYGVLPTFFVTTAGLDNQSMFYRNKVSLCIEQVRSLARDAAKMVFTSLNNALGLSLGTTADFETWIHALHANDEAQIDMTAKMLGLDIKAYLAERQPFLTREQIAQLHSDGFTIGVHTHPEQLSEDKIEEEIVEAARFVQELTKASSIPVSFPCSTSSLDRGLLQDIRTRHPFLGLFFDTKDLARDEDFIVNRVWAEKSAYRQAGRKTNLHALIRAAYRAELYAKVGGSKMPSTEE